MVILLWDASAMAKHYAPEIGSDTVDALRDSIPAAQQVSTAVSYAEIYSILLRKLNRANIDRLAFETAKSSLRTDNDKRSGFRPAFRGRHRILQRDSAHGSA